MLVVSIFQKHWQAAGSSHRNGDAGGGRVAKDQSKSATDDDQPAVWVHVQGAGANDQSAAACAPNNDFGHTNLQ